MAFKDSTKRKEYLRGWKERNRDQVVESYTKINQLPETKEAKWAWGLRKYGITVEQYYEMLEKQNHRCAICKSDDISQSTAKKWHVDHRDTPEGPKVRGLLCSSCNLGLGKFKHNTEFLTEARAYLERST